MKDLQQLIAHWENELKLNPTALSELKLDVITDTITALKQQRKLIDALRTFALTTNSVMLWKDLD